MQQRVWHKKSRAGGDGVNESSGSVDLTPGPVQLIDLQGHFLGIYISSFHPDASSGWSSMSASTSIMQHCRCSIHICKWPSTCNCFIVQRHIYIYIYMNIIVGCNIKSFCLIFILSSATGRGVWMLVVCSSVGAKLYKSVNAAWIHNFAIFCATLSVSSVSNKYASSKVLRPHPH